MKKIRLIIADPDIKFAEYAANALKLYPDIEYIYVTDNGLDALHSVRHSQCDVLLFDLLLPSFDGITLLKSINDLSNSPATICCTRFYSDVAVEAMRIYGASYILYKPVEAKSLYNAVCSTSELHNKLKKRAAFQNIITQSNDSMRISIRNYIISLGISSKLIGCSYLTEAILYALEDTTLTRNLSKGLYHEIALIMETTSSCVERSIRNAVSSAFYNHKLAESFISCPSNKEFIKYILQNLAQ